MLCTNPAWFGCDTRFADFTADAATSLEMKRGWLGSISDVSPQGDGVKAIGHVVTGDVNIEGQLIKRGWQSLLVSQCKQGCGMVGATFTELQDLEDPGWEQERARHAVCVAHWSESVGGGDCRFPCLLHASFVQQPIPCGVGGLITQDMADEAQFVSDFLFAGQPWTLNFVPIFIPRTPAVEWALFTENCEVYILNGPHGLLRPHFTVGLDAENNMFFISSGYVRLYGDGAIFMLTFTVRFNHFPLPPSCANMNEHVYGVWPSDLNCGEFRPPPFQAGLVVAFQFSGTTIVEKIPEK